MDLRSHVYRQEDSGSQDSGAHRLAVADLVPGLNLHVANQEKDRGEGVQARDGTGEEFGGGGHGAKKNQLAGKANLRSPLIFT